jgi:hemolysin D
MKPADGTARILWFPRQAEARRRHELEFLPAALEIIETPPSPVGRMIAAVIMLFLVIAITWACVSHIDIFATATGKIVPAGRVKVIQPFETGVIRAIHVVDGQAVKAGDPLVELDTPINAAESQRVAAELVPAQLEVARLRALLDGPGDPAARFVAPPGALPGQISLQLTLLGNQAEEYRAKLASIDRQIAQASASRDGAESQVQKLARGIPLLQQRVDAFKQLFDKGWGEKLQYLQLSQDLVEHQEELGTQKAKVAEANAAVASLREQRSQTEAEFQRTNRGDLATAEQKAGSLEAQLIQSQQRQHLQTLTAPVDGTVQQLAIHTVGGVVTPAQPLLVIVPVDSHLEVEAMISNRDIGFVQEGDPADIKIDTFNFTRYGLLHGTVTSVSQDAITRERPDEKANGRTTPGASSSTSEPTGQELVYAARVSLDQTRIPVEGRMVNLGSGMAVTVEIKTGQRRVIEFLLSPLLRYKQESLRER